jgi:hypothetical protein
MTITGHWSQYAQAQAIESLGLGTRPWTALDMRLYATNSNPDSGSTDEITVAGYAPQPLSDLTYTGWPTNTFDNTDEIAWAPISPASVQGVAVTDTVGNILWWVQLGYTIGPLSGGGVILPAHYFTVKLIGL